MNLLLVSMQAWAGGLRTVQCARVLGPVHVGTSDDRLPFSLASSCAGVLRSGFQNSLARRPATRKRQAAWSSDCTTKPSRS